MIKDNEGSGMLVIQGENRHHTDPMNREILEEPDIQEVKPSTLTQAPAYKGILEWKAAEPRKTTKKNI